MRLARLFALSVIAFALAACAAETPGWTYAPAPSMTPIPSAEATTPAGESAPPAGESAPPASGEPGVTTLEISAQNIQFSTDTLTAPADTAFQIAFQNNDEGIPHNVEIKDASGNTAFNGEVFSGVDLRTYDVPQLAAGTYKFLCTVHPNMTGTLTVQ